MAVIIVAGLIGTFVPLFLDKRGIDPAIATGPFITTSNDILGILTLFLDSKNDSWNLIFGRLPAGRQVTTRVGLYSLLYLFLDVIARTEGRGNLLNFSFNTNLPLFSASFKKDAAYNP